MNFDFNNSYVRELAGFYARCPPEPSPAPRLLFLNQSLATELRLDWAAHDAPTHAAIFSGNRLPPGAEPIAQTYAGHQFGHFSAQLGDGRALLIGEVIDLHGRRRDIAFKGSGRTPFSRNGDGKAAVGPMLREALMGEAMQALGIPSTRALAVVASGESVYRERALPGAILTRVAASHLRVGSFELFAARGDFDRVRQLLDYAVRRHDPELADTPERPLAFLRAVSQRQAALQAQWMGVGFIHGVMNTDNMSIAGETIDYGPCAFMEHYDPGTVFSSIDKNGRYAYDNQPRIAQWNLARLAESLLPLISDQEQTAFAQASAVIEDFPRLYQQQWLQVMRAKLGLRGRVDDGDRLDTALAEDWLSLLQSHRLDFTLAWRSLADAAEGKSPALHADSPAGHAWIGRWQARCAAEDRGAASSGPAARAKQMRKVNPWLIPRNHRVEEALAAASTDGDLEPFQRLLTALQRPYTEDAELARFAEPAAAGFTARYRTFCGT